MPMLGSASACLFLLWPLFAAALLRRSSTDGLSHTGRVHDRVSTLDRRQQRRSVLLGHAAGSQLNERGVAVAPAPSLVVGALGAAYAPGPSPLDPLGGSGGALALKPNPTTGNWEWTIVSPKKSNCGSPGPAPGPTSGPAPAPLSAPAPAPGPSTLCSSLFQAGEASVPGSFLSCEDLRYDSTSSEASHGCNCGAWSVNCPFETCGVRNAWESNCLAPPALALGFTALSKSSMRISPSGLPYPMKSFKHHKGGYMSMCAYWLPEPPLSVKIQQPGLEEPLMYVPHMPVVGSMYAELKLRGASTLDCERALVDDGSYDMTKQALLGALGNLDGLKVEALYCGSINALVSGPEVSVRTARARLAQPNFCFWVPPPLGVRLCSSAPVIPPLPKPVGSAPGPSPGLAPAPSR